MYGVQENKNDNNDILPSEELDIEIEDQRSRQGTGFVAETRKMVSQELLLSNLPAIPSEIRFVSMRKN